MSGEPRRRRRHQAPRPKRLTVRFSADEWDVVWTLARRDRLAVAAWVAVAASEKASPTPTAGPGQSDLRAVLGELNLARTQPAKAGALLNQAVAALNSGGDVADPQLEATAAFVARRVAQVDEHVDAVMRMLLRGIERVPRPIASPVRACSGPIP
jgi:hypothetical protein